MIAALIKKEKDKDKSPFISVLIHALQHPNVDVQKLTLCLLIDIKESLTDDNKQELENLSEYINPSLRSMLFELIEKQNQDSAEKPVLEVNLQEITQLLNNTHQQTLTDLGLNEIDLSKKFGASISEATGLLLSLIHI